MTSTGNIIRVETAAYPKAFSFAPLIARPGSSWSGVAPPSSMPRAPPRLRTSS